AVDLRTRDEAALFQDLEHVLFVLLHLGRMLERAVYCKTAKFPAVADVRPSPYSNKMEIIPRSRSLRDCVVYRRRGPAELPGDKREVEAERQTVWASRTQAFPAARLFRWQHL